MNNSDVSEIKVNGKVIDTEKISEEMQYHPATSQREAMINAAQALIIGELLKQKASTSGIDTSITEEDYTSQLFERDIERPQASEQECLTFYNNNPKKFMSAPLVEARHILIAAHESDLVEREQAKEEAKIILQKLTDNKNAFEELAKIHSSCPSKEVGGSLGQLSKGQTVPEFEKVLFLAEPGIQSQPVESRYGFHVLDIVNRIEGERLPFEHVQNDIRNYLNEKVKRKAIAQYIQVLIDDAEIEGFDFQAVGPLMQ